MEIILKKTIDNLGREGDVVKVKDGYARNYLLPQKFALLVTPEALEQLEAEKAAIAQRLEQEQKAADALAAKVQGVSLVIERMVGDENRLFGSVTSTDIADALAEKGIEIDKRNINLAGPIKSIGEVTIGVKVGYQMTADLTVQVVPEAGSVVSEPEAEPVVEEEAAEAETAETEAE